MPRRGRVRAGPTADISHRREFAPYHERAKYLIKGTARRSRRFGLPATTKGEFCNTCAPDWTARFFVEDRLGGGHHGRVYGQREREPRGLGSGTVVVHGQGRQLARFRHVRCKGHHHRAHKWTIKLSDPPASKQVITLAGSWHSKGRPYCSSSLVLTLRSGALPAPRSAHTPSRCSSGKRGEGDFAVTWKGDHDVTFRQTASNGSPSVAGGDGDAWVAHCTKVR